MTPRERVLTALRHEQPDRCPVDLLATPEVWHTMVNNLDLDIESVGPSDYFDPAWEAVMRKLEIDMRVLSYDMFCDPPDSFVRPGAVVTQFDEVLGRSSPNRMWRQKLPDGTFINIWGHHSQIVNHATGAYAEFASYPLQNAASLADIKSYNWPNPDWWDFSPLPEVIAHLDRYKPLHIRFRIGSIFEIGWQLRGMREFLEDLALQPEIPMYIMERLTEIYIENTQRVLDLAGDRLDMVFMYDDVAIQNSLMISRKMWRKMVKPLHARIFEVAKSRHIPIMYHCDGAIYPLIEELIEIGVDLLNPVQADAKGMDPQRLKDEFGDRLSFHGGIDIIKTLPRGTIEDVQNEVRERIRVLGKNGGYVMSSSHHIQPDTPIENALAMYDIALR